MKILGIDGSSLTASVAIVEDGILTGEYTTNYKKTHSVTLLPMLDELSKMCELDLETVDAIAVSAGPGSFTGLRIASSTAKGIGLAINKPIIEVPTVDALAFNLWGVTDIICPIMDARRGEVYSGLYSFEDGVFTVVCPQKAVPFSEIAEDINKIGRPVVFLGDGTPVFNEKIDELIKVPYRIAPAHMNRQRAASIATLGMDYFPEGKYVDADAHAPEYLRLSQAERVRNENGGV